MGRKSQFVLWLMLLLGAALAFAPTGGFAQERPRREQRRGQRLEQRREKRQEARQQAKPAQQPGNNSGAQPAGNASPPGAAQGRAGQGNARAVENLPPKWVEHLQEMSPEEQERFMNNNARFQNLPAQQKAQIHARLKHWNSLSPTERQAMRDREARWEQLSPEQRQHVRNDLLPRWQQLPQERKQLILGRLHVLHGMSESERQTKVIDEQFLRGLNPNERQILRDLNTLRNTPAS
jgi:hypothetical protein